MFLFGILCGTDLGGTITYMKASLTLCNLDALNLGNSKISSSAMSAVYATGVLYNNTRSVPWRVLSPHWHTLRVCHIHPQRGYHLSVRREGLFLGPKASGQA